MESHIEDHYQGSWKFDEVKFDTPGFLTKKEDVSNDFQLHKIEIVGDQIFYIDRSKNDTLVGFYNSSLSSTTKKVDPYCIEPDEDDEYGTPCETEVVSYYTIKHEFVYEVDGQEQKLIFKMISEAPVGYNADFTMKIKYPNSNKSKKKYGGTMRR